MILVCLNSHIITPQQIVVLICWGTIDYDYDYDYIF